MTLQRGDIVMIRIPHAGGTRGKKRPAVIIQADTYNAKLTHFIVAEITTNLAAASDPASFLVDISTPDGQATGLDQNSVVCCLFLATVAETGITKSWANSRLPCSPSSTRALRRYFTFRDSQFRVAK